MWKKLGFNKFSILICIMYVAAKEEEGSNPHSCITKYVAYTCDGQQGWKSHICTYCIQLNTHTHLVKTTGMTIHVSK